MSSGPGTTGKSPLHPEEAIEEISGLLEIDDGLTSAGAKKDGNVAEADAVDVNMETPPPASVTPAALAQSTPPAEDGSEPSANMAYEDLLEKLVLPSTGSAPAEAEAQAQATPLPALETPRPSTDAAAWRFPTGPSVVDAADERTVVTQNPLIAEEQEAAREAAAAQTPTAISDPSYQATAASTAYPDPDPVSYAQPAQVSYAQPVAYNNTPVASPVAPVVAPMAMQASPAALPTSAGRVQMSYPMLGGVVLTALIVGGLVVRYLAPAPHAAPAQHEAVVAPAPVPVHPAAAAAPVPTQPAAAATATPSPEVVPIPTPAAEPAPAAEPSKAAAPAEPAAEPEATAPAAEPAEAEPKAAPKPKAHHAAAKPAPKPAAPKPAAPAPKPAKPAGGKKPGGWSDPFAQ